MVYYYLSTMKGHIAIEEGMNSQSSVISSLVSARAYARHILNKNQKYGALWIECISKEGTISKGLVFFDRNRRMYRGLGWVYVPIDGDRALKLGTHGDVRQFTNRDNIHYAKKLREYTEDLILR